MQWCMTQKCHEKVTRCQAQRNKLIPKPASFRLRADLLEKVIVKGNNDEFVLPFPAKGEVPFMVATNIAKEWSKERVNVNTIGWFGNVENDCKIEIKK